MTGSVAEERIRAKVEAALREVWPSARIVHELMLAQGGCRVDVAAITSERLIVVEVKSERDVLDRLKRQRDESLRVADGFGVALTDKHWRKAWEGGHVSIVEAWKEDEIRVEVERQARSVHEGMTNAPARLDMLWASELRTVAETGPKANRSYSIRAGSDKFTGAEVRRRVCAALRARPFPRADPPMLCDLFPVVSRGAF